MSAICDIHFQKCDNLFPLSNVDTHHFLPGAQHSQFSKADVERGALERPIRLSDHDHVDAAWQSGLIDPFI